MNKILSEMLAHLIRSTSERILFIAITMGFLFTIVLGIQFTISTITSLSSNFPGMAHRILA